MHMHIHQTGRHLTAHKIQHPISSCKLSRLSDLGNPPVLDQNIQLFTASLRRIVYQTVL